MSQRVLEQREIDTLCHGLRIAAEQFDKDALMVQHVDKPDSLEMTALDRMVRQFRVQADTSRNLADMLENANEVIVR